MMPEKGIEVDQGVVPSVIRSRIGVAVLAVAFLCVCGAAYVIGQGASAEAARNRAIANEDENHTFCAGLGLDPATEVYGRCTEGLLAVRRRHEERLSWDLSAL
jgi:hypothetical protein